MPKDVWLKHISESEIVAKLIPLSSSAAINASNAFW